ncbi:sensor histidine kinase [Brevibacillus daliensis]|uniref:sensor histidine kinase n=1 Tax=Brevibacillus daliensis TaxID=2892995 RepID=UPI001E3F5AFB|nr:HAMP domain-containing sensor histidine kinase [Brevibacillus daliensis]
MSRIRRRIAIHFTVQFFFLWVFVAVTLLVTMLLLLQYLVNQDLKRTFPYGAVSNIATDTFVEGDRVNVPSRWVDQLTEANYWLQIVDAEGKVIYSSNAPDELKTFYGATELLNVQETGRFGSFEVMTALYTEDKPLLFMLGTEDLGADRLGEWFQVFGENGRVRSDSTEDLETQLRKFGQYIEIVDHEGKIVQTIGTVERQELYRPLELISMHTEPALHATDISVYYDDSTGNAWILHTVKKSSGVRQQPILHEVILTLIYLGGVVLLLTLAFATWHGYRYGQPLLLFTDWFERMGKGHYHEALTEKDRKKVFRKNGKIRSRYRLYKEVIAGFYDMAAKLEALERDRIRLEKTREEWMTGISHDLRTPLATIQGYGHILESGQFTFTESELKEMGSMIRGKGDYMLELLQDFSLTFQLKNNAVQIQEVIELNELVRRAVLRFVNDATIQHVDFIFEEYEIDLFMKANAKWFQRMLDNLISNAVKHNPVGTHIIVRTEKEANEVIIVVEDDGVGMDEETKRNLFDRYYRSTNTEEGTDGSGLGMSIAKAIVIAHQGVIQVESHIGSGTKIVLRFPRYKEGELRSSVAFEN